MRATVEVRASAATLQQAKLRAVEALDRQLGEGTWRIVAEPAIAIALSPGGQAETVTIALRAIAEPVAFADLELSPEVRT